MKQSFNVTVPGGDAVSVGGRLVETYRYAPSTLNDGYPFTLRDIALEVFDEHDAWVVDRILAAANMPSTLIPRNVELAAPLKGLVVKMNFLREIVGEKK